MKKRLENQGVFCYYNNSAKNKTKKGVLKNGRIQQIYIGNKTRGAYA